MTTGRINQVTTVARQRPLPPHRGGGGRTEGEQAPLALDRKPEPSHRKTTKTNVGLQTLGQRLRKKAGPAGPVLASRSRVDPPAVDRKHNGLALLPARRVTAQPANAERSPRPKRARRRLGHAHPTTHPTEGGVWRPAAGTAG